MVGDERSLQGGTYRRCLTPGMAELDHDVLTLRMCELGDLLQTLDLAVLPQTVIFWCDAAVHSNSGRFDSGHA